MWQRIQTLYLLIGMLQNGLLFGVSLAVLNWEDSAYTFQLGGMSSEAGELTYSSTSLMVVCFFSMLISLIVILMFKKRQLQIKLSQLNLFVQVILVALIFFLIDEAAKSIGNTEGIIIEYGIGTYLSLIPMIFIYLAIRGIKKDEALVRAADRIR